MVEHVDDAGAIEIVRIARGTVCYQYFENQLHGGESWRGSPNSRNFPCFVKHEGSLLS
jgi:hypothetical protein